MGCCVLKDKKLEKSPLINKKQLLNSSLIIIGLIIGFLLCYFFINKSYLENKEYIVYVDDELQIFRDSKGRKIYPIEQKGIVYLPVSEIGSYLGYMPIRNDGILSLYSIEDTGEKLIKGLNTEDYENNVITDSFLGNSEYTLFVLWATWCPDCAQVFEDWDEYSDYFKEKGVQLVSVVTDAPTLYNKEEMTEGLKGSIYNESSVANFDYYLFSDSVISNKLIGSSISIPKFVLVDNLGNTVWITSKSTKLEEVINYMNELLNY